MDIRISPTLPSGIARGLGLAVLLAGLVVAGMARAQDTAGERLGRFAASVMQAFTPEGRFDPAGFDCAEAETGKPDLKACSDPASGLGFLYLPSDAGDDLSVSITRKDATAKATDLQVVDLAEAEALRAAFVALPEAEPFDGLPRCDPTATDPLEMVVPSASFVVQHPEGGQRVTFVFGGLDDTAAADLVVEKPVVEGDADARAAAEAHAAAMAEAVGTPLLAVILVASRVGMPCTPAN